MAELVKDSAAVYLQRVRGRFLYGHVRGSYAEPFFFRRPTAVGQIKQSRLDKLFPLASVTSTPRHVIKIALQYQ